MLLEQHNFQMKRSAYKAKVESIDPYINKIEFNQKGLTIIVPHEEGDFLNTNYNPIVAFDLGCQFVAMEYQYIDNNMDFYITKFKNNSLVLKNEDLQTGHSNITTTRHTNTNTTTTRPVTRPG